MIAMALPRTGFVADRQTHPARCHRAGADLALLAEIARGSARTTVHAGVRHRPRIADVVCVMNSGKIVEQEPVEQVFTAPKHSYTRDLLAARPKLIRRRRVPANRGDVGG
jgi:microcin C transport system ATP-binding protein